MDEESETIGTAGLLLGITTDRPKLDADVAAHLEYRHYLDDTFDSEVVGGVNAFVAYAFIPERFIWVVEDNFSQISSDITAVDTPDNRENVNFLSTGPDFTIGLTARTSLQLSGRVSDEYYEERETDSQGLSGSLALIRQMSDASSVSLNGSHQRDRLRRGSLLGLPDRFGLSALANAHGANHPHSRRRLRPRQSGR